MSPTGILHHHRWIVAIAFVACTSRPLPIEPSEAAAVPPADAHADFEWTGDLSAGGVVELHSIRGDIRVRPSLAGQVRVLATKSGKGPETVEVDVKAGPDRITIRPLYHQRLRTRDTSVAFVLEVPEGLKVSANVTDGRIDAEGARSALDLQTDNGSITASDCPDIHAKTVDGSIHVEFGSTAKRAMLESVNGDVELEIGEHLGANVRASAISGTLESDFPLTRDQETAGEHGRTTLGDGSTTIDLFSVNGSVRLQRSDATAAAPTSANVAPGSRGENNAVRSAP